MGFWAKVDANANTLAALYNGSGVVDYLRIFVDVSGNLLAEWNESSGPTNSQTGSIPATLGRWYYVLFRSLGTFTSSRIDFYDPFSQTVTQTSGATPSSVNASNLDTFAFGYCGPTIGGAAGVNIAEFFYVDNDIMNFAGAVSVAAIRELALRGPFSPTLNFPLGNLKNKIVQYKAFRNSIGTNMEQPGDSFRARNIRSNWTIISTSPIEGVHPPYLASNYVRPTDFTRPSIV